jgi:hypothetical protein
MNAVQTSLPSVEYDPRLVEEAVVRALRGHADAAKFWRHRDRLYEIAGAEEREAAFARLHADWFVHLALDKPIAIALAEQPSVTSQVERCTIARAIRRKDEGAELFVNRSSEQIRRVVRIALRPESLLEEAVLTFLRRELQHVADMLDPAFGYEPSLPADGGGPTHDRLLMDRYRALWSAYIDGRLVRAGRIPGSARNERWNEFAETFGMLGSGRETEFARFFDAPAPCSHADLVAFARAPGIGGSPAGSRCALCHCPTYQFETDISSELVEAIRADFPDWDASSSICRQCADLYRARPHLALPDGHPNGKPLGLTLIRQSPADVVSRAPFGHEPKGLGR